MRRRLGATEGCLLAFLIALCASFFSPGQAWSEDKKPAGGRRGKSLNFDGSVVEGMNKNPLNSAESTDKNDRRSKLHLYRKRQNFRPELKSTAKEAGYSPGAPAGESK